MHGVKFLTYWLDCEGGVANRLVDATPSRRREPLAAAHGNLAGRIIPIDEREVLAFLRRKDAPPGTINESAARTIVITVIVGSTAHLEKIGGAAAIETLREHNRIVRSVLEGPRGRVVKNTGDGFMLVFHSMSDAVRSTIGLQQGLTAFSAESPQSAIRVRIGINAGEPVSEDGDLYGSAVNVAARPCDMAGTDEVLASAAAVGLRMGKGFSFSDAMELKGLPHPSSPTGSSSHRELPAHGREAARCQRQRWTAFSLRRRARCRVEHPVHTARLQSSSMPQTWAAVPPAPQCDGVSRVARGHNPSTVLPMPIPVTSDTIVARMNRTAEPLSTAVIGPPCQRMAQSGRALPRNLSLKGPRKSRPRPRGTYVEVGSPGVFPFHTGP